MKTSRAIILCCLFVFCSLALFSCCKSSNEENPYWQLEKDASKKNVKELRAIVLKYKNVLDAKGPSIQKIFKYELGLHKSTPFTQESIEKIETYMSTPEGEELKSYFEDFNRYILYYLKLKEKGADMSDLEIESSPDTNEELYDIRPYLTIEGVER